MSQEEINHNKQVSEIRAPVAARGEPAWVHNRPPIVLYVY